MISISVVIPTHNRAGLLSKHLRLLAGQSLGEDRFEVIVVADGCSDDTANIVRELELPYQLTVLEESPGIGASAARNRGALLAIANVLLFLDDDMEPSRQLLCVHLQAHEQLPGGVVLGYFPMQSPEERETVFTKWARLWWAEGFKRRQDPAYRFSFWDLCTGNTSIAKTAFEGAGGFDETIGKTGAGEDYELGYRLIRNRIPFQFVREAASVHHSSVSWKSHFHRAEQEGFGQAHIVRKHPELFWEFNVAHLSRLSNSILLRPLWVALWKVPKLAEPPIAVLRLIARALLSLNVQSLFWRVHRILRGYAYWKGVRAVLGTLSDWERLAQDAPLELPEYREVDFELSRDLPNLEEFLRRHGPVDALRVHAYGQPVGRIAPYAAYEALRPAHVRALLVSGFGSVLLGVLSNRAASGEKFLAGESCKSTSERRSGG